MKRLKRKLFVLLEPAHEGDRASHAIDVLICALILIDVVFFVMANGSTSSFPVFERLILVVFSLEYLLRLWVASTNTAYRGVLGRLRYMRTPMAVIDLIAIIPMLNLLGTNVPESLTAVRMFRILKLFRYFDAAMVLARTIWRVRHELGVFAVAAFMAVMSSALLMRSIEAEENPETFGTIANSLWWAVVTMTTVGYGDAVPATGLGKLVASTLMIFGIGMFALPAGLVGASFTREVTVHVERRRARSERKREERLVEAAREGGHLCPHCGKALTEHPADGGATGR